MTKGIEPYRVLFPIGVVFSLAGTALWTVFWIFPSAGYPGAAHARFMVGAFLVAFIMGFLMTAIPKMTASFPASRTEVLIAAVLTVIAGLAANTASDQIFAIAELAALSFLMQFGIRRALKRTKEIPAFFSFVATGLLCGFAGAMLLYFGDPVHTLGRGLFYQGLILCLVFGIGSRLIPVITGNPVLVRPAWQYALVAAAVPVAIGIEHLADASIGAWLKAALGTLVAVHLWGLQRGSKKPSKLAPAIRMSALMVVVGLWMAAFKLENAVHWLHLMFVGGFGLMTFTVASRVTLAHGHHDLTYESDQKVLPVIGILILAAAATRALGPFFPELYISHLAYAAIAWMAGVLIWALLFLKKIFIHGQAAEGC